jgi:hypothetical protein
VKKWHAVFAALAVALMCAPGTWLRSDVPKTVPHEISVVQIAGPQATDMPGWELAGIWQYDADSTLFGGFSALTTLGPDRLRAFSDRGSRMTFTEPDRPNASAQLNRQFVEPGWEWDLWDIESVTHDPETGTYWLGYEQTHTIHRFTIASKTDGLRDLSKEVDWADNSGIEAMVRLADGRFVILPEHQSEGLLFAGDPVDGGAPETFRIVVPAKGFAVTGAKEMPDGRLLVLMRKVTVSWQIGWPPFESLLAIGDVPQAGGTFAPQIALRVDNVLPRDNYEGLAVRERADGRVDVWIIADDNFSVFQRNLLAKLIFAPAP